MKTSHLLCTVVSLILLTTSTLAQNSVQDQIKQKTQLAVSYMATKPDSVIIIMQEAVDIARSTNNDSILLKPLSTLGALAAQFGKLPLAVNSFEELYEIGVKRRDSKIISGSSINLGNCFMVKGNYSKAVYYQLKASKILEQLKDTLYISTSYYCIGAAYFEWENYQKSRHYFNDALKASKRVKSPQPIINSLIGLAGCDRLLGDYNKALRSLNEANALNKTLGVPNPYINSGLGEVYLNLNKDNQALRYLQTAQQQLEVSKDPKATAEVEQNLGLYWLKQKNYTKARTFLERSRRSFTTIGAKKSLSRSVAALYQLEKEAGNTQAALKLHEQYSELKDSLFTENTGKQIAEMQEKYDTEKRVKQINVLTKDKKKSAFELERANNIRNILVSLVVILILVSLLIYNIYKRKQQRERNLAQKQLYEERSRISRELHDNIGSQLTYIISNIETIDLRLSKENAESPTRESLDKLGDFARDTMGQLREAIWTMNKDHITLKELKERVQSFLQQFMAEHPSLSWELDWNIDASRTLQPLQSLNLFRVMQEATTNCIKYSQASKFLIRVSENEGKLKIWIEDNGVGFDPANFTHGHGLKNIVHRITEIGGTADIQGNPGKGSRIEINLLN